jgi:hypothetical protein
MVFDRMADSPMMSRGSPLITYGLVIDAVASTRRGT